MQFLPTKIPDIILVKIPKFSDHRGFFMETYQAKKFNEVHNDKTFYNDLVEYMSSEPVIVQILEGDKAISKYRDIMGSTDPHLADEGTIRKLVAISKQENSVHGSDSIENALKEINFFFENDEIVG